MAFVGIVTSKKNESLLRNMLIKKIKQLNLDEKIILINGSAIFKVSASLFNKKPFSFFTMFPRYILSGSI